MKNPIIISTLLKNNNRLVLVYMGEPGMELTFIMLT